MKKYSVISLLGLVFICGGFVAKADAFVVKDIIVNGVNKFDPNLVKSAVDIKIGTDISKSDLDLAIKKLYSMNIFSNISAVNNNGILVFNVVENAVINEIFFEGNDELTQENILKELTIKPKSMYSKSIVRMNATKLIDMYRALGFLSAEVNPKTINRENGQVDIVFEIIEGEKAYIKEIHFIGNEKFTKPDLLKEIMSKEYGFWKLLSQHDTFDENRIKYDTELLKKFYVQNGYLDVVVDAPIVKSSVDKASFYVDLTLKEGRQYKIGDVKIISNIPDIKVDDLYTEIALKKDYLYYGSLITLSIKNLSDKLGARGYAFIQVDPDIKKNKETGYADITLHIRESKKVYINNINIIGNTRTLDTVIRREMEIKEQDAYNVLALKNSEQRLGGIGYFKNVALSLNPDFTALDKVNVDVRVEENSTGEMSASVGWSSLNGLILELGIKENNFRGKGQKVAITGSWSDLQKRLLFSFTEPYFMDRDLSAGFDVSYTRYDYYKNYGYNVDSLRIGGRLGWTWTQKLYQSVGISLQGDLYSNISPELRDSITDGFVPLSKIYQSLVWRDGLPNYFQNTKWDYSAQMYNELSAGLSEHPYFKTDVELKTSYMIADYNITLGTMVNGGHIEPFEESLLRTYRYFLGGDNLRGFATAGAGSRLNSAYTAGGNSIIYGNVQLGFPIGISKEYKISGFLFYDFGWVAPPDDKDVLYNRLVQVPIDDPAGKPPTDPDWVSTHRDDYIPTARYTDVDSSFRTSVGFGIFWGSLMGPIKLTWGYPLKYKDYDELERFRFSISTLF